MLGYYNYTVILTYVGMLASFAGILFAVSGDPTAALLCLMLSGFCDMFDGKVAATRKRTEDEKCFGIQIDSLSDLICFGALPAVILHSLRPESIPVNCVAGLFLLCALIRLAYFNVDEARRQGQTTERRKEYRGLPVTSAALLVPLLYALEAHFHLRFPLLAVGMTAMGVGFLSPFRLKKPDLPGMIVMIAIALCELLFILRGDF